MTGVQTCALPICFPVTIGCVTGPQQIGATQISTPTGIATFGNQSSVNTANALQMMSGLLSNLANAGSQASAKKYNSAEALANREWQEHMSNTAYQRAVEDMKKAGINPILAFANGGASTPGGSAGTISGASMGLASSSALGVSRSGGFVPNAYESNSWSKSDWYNAAQSWQQMLSSTQMTPYGLMKTLSPSIVTGKQIGRAHV